MSSRWLLLTIALMLPGLVSTSHAAQIRVQFLNGKNGKPIARTKVVINDVTLHQLIGVLQTDKQGFISVKVDRQSQIQALVERSFNQSCDSNKGRLQAYKVEQILSQGIVEKNECGATLPSPRPGILVRIFRRSTFVEALREN